MKMRRSFSSRGSDPFRRKLRAYSGMAAAASLLLHSNMAEGQVIYTDVDPDAVIAPYYGYGTEYPVDFEGDGLVEFNVDGAHRRCYTHFYFSFLATSAWLNDRIPSVLIGGRNSWWGEIYGFEEGDLVGSDIPFIDPSYRSGKEDPLTVWSCSWRYNYGQYDGPMFAVRIEREGQFHYGWVRLTINDSIAPSVLYDYAFEATPNQPIVAGQIPPLSAKNDWAEIPIGGSIVVPVLDNDYAAIDKSLLSVSISQAPNNGTANVEADRSIRYAANPGFFGRDTLTYRVTDTAGNVRFADLNILVDDPPQALIDTASTIAGEAVLVDVLDNDTDLSGGLDSNSISIWLPPNHGNTIIQAPEGILYTPAVGHVGIDSFGYTVCDVFDQCSNAIVRVETIPPDDFGAGILLTDALSSLQVIQLGDITGDGALDVIYAVRGQDRVSAQFNTRPDGFSIVRDLVDPLNRVNDLILAPLNGGARPDLLTHSPTDGMVYWHRHQINHFSAGFPLLSAPSQHVLAVGDLDGDTAIDLILAGKNSGDLRWLPNPAVASGASAVLLADSLFGASRIVVADLDNDGDQDLAISLASAGKVLWLANDGSGDFGPVQILDSDADLARDLHASDLDGDGNTDLIAAVSGANEVRLYRNQGSGIFTAAEVLATGSNPTDIESADLDGDGWPDIAVVYQGDGVIKWLPNAEGAGFEEARRIASLAGVHSMSIGDLNQDGLPDVAVIGDAPDRAVWFPNELPMIPCRIPDGLTSMLLSDSSVFLSWNPVYRANAYRVRIGPEGMGLAGTHVLASIEPGVTVSGPFSPGTLYEWTVRAACPADKSGYASHAELTWPSPRLESVEQESWTLAPNPSSGILKVQSLGGSKDDPWTLELLDAKGQILDHWSGSQDQITLDLSRWPSGLYTIRRSHSNGEWSYRKVVLD